MQWEGCRGTCCAKRGVSSSNRELDWPTGANPIQSCQANESRPKTTKLLSRGSVRKVAWPCQSLPLPSYGNAVRSYLWYSHRISRINVGNRVYRHNGAQSTYGHWVNGGGYRISHELPPSTAYVCLLGAESPSGPAPWVHMQPVRPWPPWLLAHPFSYYLYSL